MVAVGVSHGTVAHPLEEAWGVEGVDMMSRGMNSHRRSDSFVREMGSDDEAMQGEALRDVGG